MNQCLRITFKINYNSEFLHEVILPIAREIAVEGIAQWIGQDLVKIIVCGQRDAVDAFVDSLHGRLASYQISELELEPFIKDKEYRGVFRVIE
jgi:acylphosphatase